MQLKQFYDIATKLSSRKKCYFIWWSTWLITVMLYYILYVETTIVIFYKSKSVSNACLFW